MAYTGHKISMKNIGFYVENSYPQFYTSITCITLYTVLYCMSRKLQNYMTEIKYITGLAGEEDYKVNKEYYDSLAEKELTAEEQEARNRTEGDYQQDEESDNELSGM